MPLALSTPAWIAVAAGLLLIALLVRLIGLWLIRKGGAMERARHGVLPGVAPEPRRAGRTQAPEQAPSEPERHDPFDAG